MKSRLYEGLVRHRRLRPRHHEFSYRVFMPYINLDEIDTLFEGRWLWSAKRPALARFKREDFLGDPSVPLKDEVRRRIREETGQSHHGPIYLLANLRYFGFNINPIACYYCFDTDGSGLEYLVAAVDTAFVVSFVIDAFVSSKQLLSYISVTDSLEIMFASTSKNLL